MSEYKRLVLDPRCLKPAHQIKDNNIYFDAITAIDAALSHPYITDSEIQCLLTLKYEVQKNRSDYTK
jgi:hypothetical protein